MALVPFRPRFLAAVLLLAASVVLSACVYRVDVQQGNLLDEVDIQAVKPGMTRNQVRFLLGTPVVNDPFHTERWDYMYFLRPGKTRQVRQRWLIVYFDGDAVREIRRDVPVGSSGQPPADVPPVEEAPGGVPSGATEANT